MGRKDWGSGEGMFFHGLKITRGEDWGSREVSKVRTPSIYLMSPGHCRGILRIDRKKKKTVGSFVLLTHTKQTSFSFAKRKKNPGFPSWSAFLLLSLWKMAKG